ncbi:MAG: DegT/DnrJ/EryC1/StrS family aminotransferase [Planctomycetes bacterium]|nr:DegT/DnrJ/EryC1/StrS family aminotransferase [Planctomycetota bacterium]
MPVPFNDLFAQYRTIKSDVDAAVAAVIEKSAFVGGAFVSAFERDFAAFTGASHAVACSNGTDAITLALLALGVGPGDEVVAPALTFIATTEAVSRTGATVVFADCDLDARAVTARTLAAATTKKTRALLPVHLYGQPCDMAPIRKFAEERGVAVVEDAAQAHGALDHGAPLGRGSAAATYSFYPGKNLGAFGDAGAVTTDRDDLAATVRLLRDHGRREKYTHEREGFNHRMDGLQAAVLAVKLRRLAQWNDARRAVADAYDEAFATLPLRLPPRQPEARGVYHLYVVLHPERDRLAERLRERGIGTGVHYPVPLHLQPAYARLGHGAGDFPAAERIARECLSLPIFPEMIPAQVSEVIAAVKAAI